MSAKYLILRGVTWIAAARAVVALLGIVSTVCLARLLAPEDFGLVAVGSTIAVLIASVTELSMAQALVQHDEPKDVHYRTAWTMNVIRSLVLCGIILILAWPASKLYGDERLGTILSFLAFSTVINGLQNPKLVVFQRKLIFWQEFVLGVSEKLAGLIVSLILAIIFANYWALILGSTSTQLVRCILSYAFIPFVPRFSLGAHRELLSFSVWLTLSKTIQMINWRVEPLILGLAVAPSMLGQYTVAKNLAGMPLREGIGPIRQTLFPAFSLMKNDRSRLRHAYQNSQGALCMLVFPIGFGVAALAEPAVLLLLGEKWLIGVPFLQIATLTMSWEACEGFRTLSMSLGKTRDMFNRELLSAAIRLPLIILGTALGGYFGGDFQAIYYAAIGLAIASLINVVWNMALVKKYISLSVVEQFSIIIRPISCSFLMYFLVKIADNAVFLGGSVFEKGFHLFTLMAIGAISYFLILYLFWFALRKPAGSESYILDIVRKWIYR